jgi:hypothetical protein
MTKHEQREVRRVRSLVATGLADIAARMLATSHRMASRRSQAEIAAVIEGCAEMREHLDVVNGCYIPRDDATRNALTLQACKAAPRRFTGESITGFGSLQ